MKIFHITGRHSTQTHTITDDFYAEISRDWEDRARKLQARRWRALKDHMQDERI